MSSKHGKQRKRRPLTNTLAIALAQATRFTPAELGRMREHLEGHLAALREGRATRVNFAGISTASELSLAIETQGVVRGLSEHLERANSAMHAVRRRSDLASGWRTPTLHWDELDALTELLRLHLFQLEQLSYGEYQAAWRLMVGRVTSNGGEIIHESTTT